MEAIIILLVLAVVWIYPAICLQRIAQKSKTEHDWLAWVPIASLYLVCKLARTSGWWVLLCCIPYIGAIFALVLLSRIPRCLGVTDGSRFLIIVPGINIIYLGYLAFRQESPDSENAINQELPPSQECKTSAGEHWDTRRVVIIAAIWAALFLVAHYLAKSLVHDGISSEELESTRWNWHRILWELQYYAPGLATDLFLIGCGLVSLGRAHRIGLTVMLMALCSLLVSTAYLAHIVPKSSIVELAISIVCFFPLLMLMKALAESKPAGKELGRWEVVLWPGLIYVVFIILLKLVINPRLPTSFTGDQMRGLNAQMLLYYLRDLGYSLAYLLPWVCFYVLAFRHSHPFKRAVGIYLVFYSVSTVASLVFRFSENNNWFGYGGGDSARLFINMICYLPMIILIAAAMPGKRAGSLFLKFADEIGVSGAPGIGLTPPPPQAGSDPQVTCQPEVLPANALSRELFQFQMQTIAEIRDRLAQELPERMQVTVTSGKPARIRISDGLWRGAVLAIDDHSQPIRLAGIQYVIPSFAAKVIIFLASVAAVSIILMVVLAMVIGEFVPAVGGIGGMAGFGMYYLVEKMFIANIKNSWAVELEPAIDKLKVRPMV